MRFRLGLLTGGGIGYWLATRSNDQKRRDLERLVERLRSEPRVEQVREAITGTVAGAARKVTSSTDTEHETAGDLGRH